MGTSLGISSQPKNPYCISELSLQLLTLVIFKQLVSQMVGTGVPWLRHKYDLWKERNRIHLHGAFDKELKDLETQSSIKSKKVQEIQLIQDSFKLRKERHQPKYPGTFFDYNEMIIQFGYV